MKKNDDIENQAEQQEKNQCQCEDCHCHEEQLDYKDLYMRTMADFENYRKRTFGAISQARFDGTVEALNTILPALDTLQQATSMITDKTTLTGLEFIQKNIKNALTDLGVEEINAEGQFNPEMHCAVSTETEGDAPSGSIVKVLSTGYKLGDKIIKYPQVVVKK